MKYLDPAIAFGARLATIEKPVRYLGGESGSVVKENPVLTIALCFPDVYEIGMTNNAMKILYAGLNAIDGVQCERVFSVGSDYEALLRGTGTRLYGLETGRQLADFDILAFTVGYELAATNIVGVLDLGGIQIRRSLRSVSEPLVIAGGPAITNPVPYTDILDGVWVGEAENAFFELARILMELKKDGASRHELREALQKNPAVWIAGKRAVRHVHEDFADAPFSYSFPVPNVKPVQNHGVVEIMRGCPNGCRFCHAGYFYRPQRFRSVDMILKDVETLVVEHGYREITLSSLSTGDYPGLPMLLQILNQRWSAGGISFQLPSLKVESFKLELIEQVSGVRKSGLTFAIETPDPEWQKSVNKMASFDKIVEILDTAARRGYRVAKLYFMTGLPGPEKNDISDTSSDMPEISEYSEEADLIVSFIKNMESRVSGLNLNVTIATFVPKPHTPYQWSRQLPLEKSYATVYRIKDAFRKDSRVKITYHDPFMSMLEGMMARGDERAGNLVLSAWRHGARFDAWDDQLDKAAWNEAMTETGVTPAMFLDARKIGDPLPWDGVSLRISKKYLLNELKRSDESVLTEPCAHDCRSSCGACSPSSEVAETEPVMNRLAELLEKYDPDMATGNNVGGRRISLKASPNGTRYRILVRYGKSGAGAYIPHHELHGMLASSMQRAGIDIAYSEGFNPMPRMEISEPLPLGFESDDEYALILLPDEPAFNVSDAFKKASESINTNIQLYNFMYLVCPPGQHFPALSATHWGSVFSIYDRSAENSRNNSIRQFANTVAQDGALHVSDIAGKIKSELDKHPQLAGSSLQYENDESHLTLRFRASRQKETGLSAIFQAATGVSLRDSGLQFRRIAQLAISAEGTQGMMESPGSCSYFERYSRWKHI